MIKSAARTLGICSGKGGVGKTYCAINLAKSISRKGKKVLLIDCDFNLGNCAFLLGQKNYKTLVNISDGEKIEDCIEQLKYFDFIGAESGDMNILDGKVNLTEVLLKVIMKLQSYYDYILLDFGAGLDKKLLNILAYCDYRFVVVNSNNLSLKDSYAMMKVLKNKYGTNDFNILSNKLSGPKDFTKIENIISQMNNRFLKAEITYTPPIYVQDEVLDQVGWSKFRERVSSQSCFDKVIKNFFDNFDEVELPFWNTPQKQDAFFARLRSN